MLTNTSFVADFMNDYGYLDPRIIFNRPVTGIATYSDRQSILRTRSANNPRFGFHQISGLPAGLRLEGQATNLIAWSEDQSQRTASNGTIGSNVVTAPDGNLTGDLLTITGSNGYLGTSFPITAGNMVISSAFMKAAPGGGNIGRVSINPGTGDIAFQNYDLVNGVLGQRANGQNTCVWYFSSMEPWPNGWWRCVIGAATTTTTACNSVYSAPTTDTTGLPPAGGAVYLWGLMAIQVAPTATPVFNRQSTYIATPTISTVTRNNDSCYVNLPDPTWYDPNQGTLFADFSIPIGNGGNPNFVLYTGATTSDYMGIGAQIGSNGTTAINCGIFAQLVAGGTTQISGIGYALTSIAFDTPYRAAMGYRLNDLVTSCVNGGAVVKSPQVPAIWPAVPQRMTIGGAGWSQASTSGLDIRRIAYFPRKLTDAQMQLITK
jgi:hypothetical protein